MSSSIGYSHSENENDKEIYRNDFNLNKRLGKLVEYFGLSYESLEEIIYETKSFIAGSSALTTFLDIPPFDGQDLDIFMRIPLTQEDYLDHNRYLSKYYPSEKLAKHFINSILEKAGYVSETISEQCNNYCKKTRKSELNLPLDEIEYYNCALSHYIKNIRTYWKKVGSHKILKIQVITLYQCSIEEFLDTFDLNICRLAICSMQNIRADDIHFFHQSNNYLDEHELTLIKSRKMYIHNVLYIANLENRLLKYTKRNFDLIDKSTETNIVDLKEHFEKLNITKSFVGYDEYISKRYKVNINKTIFKEMIDKILEPSRIIRISKEQNIDFVDLLELYSGNMCPKST